MPAELQSQDEEELRRQRKATRKERKRREQEQVEQQPSCDALSATSEPELTHEDIEEARLQRKADKRERKRLRREQRTAEAASSGSSDAPTPTSTASSAALTPSEANSYRLKHRILISEADAHISPVPSFASAGFPQTLLSATSTFTQPTPIQAQCWPVLLQRRDCIAIADTGSGKCFARGTRLRLFNGDLVAVEDVVGGEWLMGDDGHPRTVTLGSLTQGIDTLYEITPSWGGAQPFTVNGAHILVLTNNDKPWMSERGGRSTGWEVCQWGLSTDNRMIRRSRTYRTEVAARQQLNLALANWTPIMWEPSVEEFMQASDRARHVCKLIACNAITFVNPQLPSLFQVLTQVLGAAPSAAQVDYMAWWLGMWLTDGDAAQPRISQGGAPPPDPHHHHEIFARLLGYTQRFGEPVAQLFDQMSTAGFPVYWFEYGAGSVAHRVLRRYGLLGNKHMPRAFIYDSMLMRVRFLAGILDGDGDYHPGNNDYELEAERRHVIDGYKELAATLGLRNSDVAGHLCTNQQTGQVYQGYRLCLSGDMWDVVQFCAATYKRCPTPGTAKYVEKDQDSRCYGFRIEELDDGEYFGFAVHGGANRRFLLEDYTVTHNTLGFVLPGLTRLLSAAPLLPASVARQRGTFADGASGPLMLILSPTRELAQQTAAVASAAAASTALRTAVVYGGADKRAQLRALDPLVHVVVATPGRLLALLEEGSLSLRRVELLVLDEADRMLDMGFEEAVRAILAQLGGTATQGGRRQTVMFSATWPTSVQRLANEFIHDPVHISIGDIELRANVRVSQTVLVLPSDADKAPRLLQLLAQRPSARVLIFVLYKKEIGSVERLVSRQGYRCVAISGDKSQADREASIAAFKLKKVPILIATDVVGRGLDIDDVDLVINFTFPLTVEDYVHRVGRTGRGGKAGASVTFFTKSEKHLSGELINVLRQGGEEVPKELIAFGTGVKRKEHGFFGQHFKKITDGETGELKKSTKVKFDD